MGAEITFADLADETGVYELSETRNSKKEIRNERAGIKEQKVGNEHHSEGPFTERCLFTFSRDTLWNHRDICVLSYSLNRLPRFVPGRNFSR